MNNQEILQKIVAYIEAIMVDKCSADLFVVNTEICGLWSSIMAILTTKNLPVL